MVLDRTKSSLNRETKLDLQEATYFPVKDAVIDCEIFIDVSVLEVFVDQRAAFATRIYPLLPEHDGLALLCLGGEAIAPIEGVEGTSPARDD